MSPALLPISRYKKIRGQRLGDFGESYWCAKRSDLPPNVVNQGVSFVPENQNRGTLKRPPREFAIWPLGTRTDRVSDSHLTCLKNLKGKKPVSQWL